MNTGNVGIEKTWNVKTDQLCDPQEGHCEKKCEIQGGSQEMAVMVKFFCDDNSGEFGAQL